MLEFAELVRARPVHAQIGWALVLGSFWYLASFFVLAGIISERWLMFVVLLIMAVFITELFRKSNTPLLNIACTLIFPFYVALPFSFLHFLVFKEGSYDYLLLLGFFLLVWANDSGAYLIGVRFGKHRLFPRISPRKSWEGAVGGFVFTLAIAFVLSLFIEQLRSEEHTSELQSRPHLVCRLLLEKKKQTNIRRSPATLTTRRTYRYSI